MRVLSLFDGISCGQIALNRAGVKVDEYFASEIKDIAMKVTQFNYPKTIQVGDVTRLDFEQYKGVDILIGGSPCQDLSIAMSGRQGLKGSQSSLFYYYVKALETIKPKYFLLENVARMSADDRDVITNTLGGGTAYAY